MKNLYLTELKRSDLMELEEHLVNALRNILPFTSHSLYFPTAQNTPEQAQWIPKERTLILPLRHKDEDFGVFMARGLKAKDVQRLLPSLPAIATLTLEHLLYIKQSRIDELTGLSRMSRLLLRMEQNADMVRASFLSNNEYNTPSYKACMALLVVRCPALNSLATDFGYMFAHKALSAWAKAIQKGLPEEVFAARSDENECTLLIPAATRSSCTKLAEEILKKTDELSLTHEPSKRVLRLHCVAGFALYPQDMESKCMALPMSEQAHHLLHNARLAADTAHERSKFFKNQKDLQTPCMPYANILSLGGIVREVLPLGQLVTNLNRYVGAREGQLFSVWDPKGRRKGEIVLVEVKDTHSIAESLLQDPANPWEIGDTLRLTDERPSKDANSNEQTKQHIITDNSLHISSNLLNHADFLRRFTYEREARASFALSLVRLTISNDNIEKNQEDSMQSLIQLCHYAHKEGLGLESHTQPSLQGRYGETSLVFFHPSLSAENLYEFYVKLVQNAHEQNIKIAVGIASYPYLECHKGDILEYCHKALELALLLPEPQVGIMGSLALNISADQHYSRGNTFKAVEEYKLALLADPNNAMAWNSLGVCMAALARPTEAHQYFKEALKIWKKHPPTENNKSEYTATLYNLGTICQSTQELRSAGRYFRQCIEIDDEHYFAHIRLGQLSENSKKYRQARQYYSIAAEYEDKNKQYGGMARRHLARVALKQNKGAEARELIHEALLRNPQDAMALYMLAKLYLDSGEDPSMSEMLARKSVGLRPEYAKSWHVLAQSLRAMGRENDALHVEHRASLI